MCIRDRNNSSASGWSSLWYVLPTTSSFNSLPGQFRVVSYLNTIEVPAPNWVFICGAFTDPGQQVIRWQPGSVVLPIPSDGHQIQWGGNSLQLGRGANKLSLDGGTGNAAIPGVLTLNNDLNISNFVANEGATAYGRLRSVDQYHAVILRGDINYTAPNYTVTGGQNCTCFVQFGGTWRFRHVNSTSNVLLCEITPDNILYKSVALERIPWVSALVQLSGAVTNNRGQRVAACTKGGAGEYNITWQSIPYPSGGADYIVHLTPRKVRSSSTRRTGRTFR